MKNEVYVVKKVMVLPNGKKNHIFMTNGNSEVLEMDDKDDAKKLVKILNENSDSGWDYEIVVIKNR